MTSPEEDTARIGRIQPTIYSSRPSSINSNSLQSLDAAPSNKIGSPSSSPGLPTIASKPQKPVISSPISMVSGKTTGSTVYNIQEQMQPPSVNSQHYLFPTLSHSTTTPSSASSAQQFIPAGL